MIGSLVFLGLLLLTNAALTEHYRKEIEELRKRVK